VEKASEVLDLRFAMISRVRVVNINTASNQGSGGINSTILAEEGCNERARLVRLPTSHYPKSEGAM
jgi:hypothetical protein